MNDYSYHITLDVMMNNTFTIQNVYLTRNDYFDGFTSISELPGTVPAKQSVLRDQNIASLFRCESLLAMHLAWCVSQLKKNGSTIATCEAQNVEMFYMWIEQLL